MLAPRDSYLSTKKREKQPQPVLSDIMGPFREEIEDKLG